MKSEAIELLKLVARSITFLCPCRKHQSILVCGSCDEIKKALKSLEKGEVDASEILVVEG